MNKKLLVLIPMALAGCRTEAPPLSIQPTPQVKAAEAPSAIKKVKVTSSDASYSRPALIHAKGNGVSSWQNPDNGHHGVYRVGSYSAVDGKSCRSIVHTLYVGGAPKTEVANDCVSKI